MTALGRRRPSTHARGRKAERAGTRWLTARGYRVVERNYRTRLGEIDLIAQEGGVLCFVEIKARRSAACGRAVEAVSLRQRSRVSRAAQLFLQKTGWEGPCRFDVLGLDRREGEWVFSLVRNAFEAAP